MAKKEKDTAAAQTLRIETIYVKGLLFEVSKPDAVSAAQKQPTGDVHIGTIVSTLGDNRYEVVLDVKVNAKDRDSDDALYRFELRQAGVFTLENFSDATRDQALNVYCPNVLFPYARQQVSSAIVGGGFPSIMLSPVNFEELYRQQLANREQSSGESESTAKH